MKRTILTAAIFLSTLAAHADPYVNLNIGLTKHDPATPLYDYNNHSSSNDHTSPAFELAVGYYFTDNLALEIAYVDMASFRSSTYSSAERHDKTITSNKANESDLSAARLSLVYTHYLGEEFAVSANVGVAAWRDYTTSTLFTSTVRGDAVVNLSSSLSTSEENGVDATFGILLHTTQHPISLGIGVQYYNGLDVTVPYIGTSITF